MRFSGWWDHLTGNKIVIYADFIDPFCYIGFHALKPLAEARNIPLDWRGFELNPGTPPEGLPLVTAANSDIRPGMWASVEALARKAGLNFPEPRSIPNTRKAHLLVEWAKKWDVKNPLIERIYQAYFIQQADIGQNGVLIDLASAFKLPMETLEAVLTDATKTHTLETHRAEVETRRFLGMPGYIYKGKNYFGALSTDAWENIFNRTPHK